MMEFRLFHIFTFLSVTTLLAMVVVGSYGTSMSSIEAYWKSVLPNTPIPKAIIEILHPAAGPTDGKSVLAKDIEKANHANDEKLATTSNSDCDYGPDTDHLPTTKLATSSNSDYDYSPDTDHLPTTKLAKRSNGDYDYGPDTDHLPTTGNTLEDELKVAPYFLEQDMHRGASINVHFTKSISSATFLPREEAEAIPFSSSKFLETLKLFSVKPGSMEAKIMGMTISECEGVALKGKERYCATSLESMIDFTTSKLGNEVEVISTEATKETTIFQKYTITEVKKMGGDKSVVCHKNLYPYAVYYCQKVLCTAPYMVSLLGADGTKIKAAVVCHSDMTAWNPKHVAFKVLKVKPGSATICRYLRMDTLLWVPK